MLNTAHDRSAHDVKKAQERIFGEAAAKLLVADWQIIDIPEPLDFEVLCDGERFGLEVRQVFIDQEADYGSPRKYQEAGNRKIVARLAKRYYELGGSPVSAKFLGGLSHCCIDDLAKQMCSLAPQYPGSHIEFATASMKVFLTPLPVTFGAYSRWILVNDSVGWLRDITPLELQHAVDKKADKLASYKQKYPSIDLLLVADRIFNSGRLAACDNLTVENPGFRTIYFMSYPESIQRVG